MIVLPVLVVAATPAITETLAITQAATATLPTLVEDRLRVCLDQARTDPPTAITTASQWAKEGLGANTATGQDASAAQQCLGFAYMSLLRWDAAEQAFVAARDALPADDRANRARLGAMAGNAGLATEAFPRAAELLAGAQDDAETAGLTDIAGSAAADRARALVAQGQADQAAQVLTGAQIIAPQMAEIWLLSATLARRANDLRRAASLIRTATELAPQDPEVGLEAGLIAALAGDEATARSTWNAIVARDPTTPQAEAARAYLAQLDEGAPPQ